METIAHQIARHKEQPVYQQKVGKGWKRSKRSRELNILLNCYSQKLSWNGSGGAVKSFSAYLNLI
ncbi:hypothetical protein GJU39_15985 [Pedobacter petrophilus]|uniref:Uncharacterized protein n=1 Tax=Pedobacter petrophilus TaxID=1908241 RepID=A0A7K0G168_9SPHI|nr:hypothetical protein [Pedobacter petrophilus]